MNDNDQSILSITMLGHGMVHMYELAIPIFITVWIADLGVGSATLGLAVSVGYALYGIGSLPSGVVTDTYGSKRLLVVCLLGMGISFGLLAFVEGLLGVTLALAIWGIAASTYHPAGLRLISTGVTDRGAGFGYHGIAGNVGIALGPLVAATLLIVFDWRIVAGVMAVPAFAAALYTTYVSVDELAAIESPSHPTETDGGSDAPSPSDSDEANASRLSLRSVIGDTRVIFSGGFLIAFPMLVLEGFFYRGVLTFLPDMLAGYESLGAMTIAGQSINPSGYVFVGLLVVGMAGQYVGGKVSDIMPPEKAAVGAFLSMALITLLFVPVALIGLLPLLVITGLLGFVLFGEQPLLQAIAADYSDSDVRGLSYGYMYVGVFGVGSLGAAFSGAILAYTTQQVLFILLSVVPFIAGLIAAMLWRSDRGE